MTPAPEEAQLALDFAARKSGALDKAYAQYGRALFAVAAYVVGHSDAEDCVHDALLRVWARRDSYAPERGTLPAFLAACVRNEALAASRSADRRSKREGRASLLEAPPSEEIEVVDHVEAARVRAALERLPLDQRVALERAYYRCETQSAIAGALGVPLGTVKSRLALGLRRLAADLAPKGST